MMNIDNHIINYKRNFLANFSQINNGRCKYIYIYIYIYFFSKQIKSFHPFENEIKKQKVYLLFQNAKCTSVNKM